VVIPAIYALVKGAALRWARSSGGQMEDVRAVPPVR
jgi:hypothetical protein